MPTGFSVHVLFAVAAMLPMTFPRLVWISQQDFSYLLSSVVTMKDISVHITQMIEQSTSLLSGSPKTTNAFLAHISMLPMGRRRTTHAERGRFASSSNCLTRSTTSLLPHISSASHSRSPPRIPPCLHPEMPATMRAGGNILSLGRSA